MGVKVHEPKGPTNKLNAQLIEVPPEGQLGPCMRALDNERQRAFVIAMCNIGPGVNNTRCAELAGYHGDKNSIKVLAHRLAHSEKIQHAIHEEGQKRLKYGTAYAISTLLEAMQADRTNKHGDLEPDWKSRISAANSVLDRGGMHAVTEQHIGVHHSSETREEKLMRVVALAKQQGLDPAQLIGNLADFVPSDLKVIEGEVVENNTESEVDHGEAPPDES